jgi:hypothetical protein
MGLEQSATSLSLGNKKNTTLRILAPLIISLRLVEVDPLDTVYTTFNPKGYVHFPITKRCKFSRRGRGHLSSI